MSATTDDQVAVQGKPTPEAQDFIDNVIQAVADLPDRSSSAEQPKALLITHEELEGILIANLLRLVPSTPPDRLVMEIAERCVVTIQEATRSGAVFTDKLNAVAHILAPHTLAHGGIDATDDDLAWRMARVLAEEYGSPEIRDIDRNQAERLVTWLHLYDLLASDQAAARRAKALEEAAWYLQDMSRVATREVRPGDAALLWIAAAQVRGLISPPKPEPPITVGGAS